MSRSRDKKGQGLLRDHRFVNCILWRRSRLFLCVNERVQYTNHIEDDEDVSQGLGKRVRRVLFLSSRE